MAKGQKVRARIKTGLAGAPIDGDDYNRFKIYVHYDVDAKEQAGVVKNYASKYYTKGEVKAVMANPKWAYLGTQLPAVCYWDMLENKFTGKYSHGPEFIKSKFKELIAKGKVIIKAENAALKQEEDKPTKAIVTPLMRMIAHNQLTIMEDLYLLEDAWIKNDKNVKLNLYHQMQVHSTKRFVEVEAWVNEYIPDYEAFMAKDEDMLEAYAHLTRKEIKNRLVILNGFLDDINLMKASKKATRKVKVKKPIAVDKQVAKLKYKPLDNDFKLTSIQPMRIPGAMNLWFFNTKTRALTILNSESPNGMTVKGSAIKGFDPKTSIQLKLRKPEDILPTVLKKSPTQIMKLISGLKTKVKVPNGRVNAEMIILRSK
jgi:hypothetical protein